MNILVVGGAGYIGSHMVKHLGDTGHRVVTFDNLSTGFADAVVRGELVQADLADRVCIESTLRDYRIEAVFHFASCIEVVESIRDPSKYYQNNVVNALNLLDAMRVAHVNFLVFSSTAAVYGETDLSPIPETKRRAPINPYGRTKSIVEDILRDYHSAYGLHSFALRYFNAAGADPDGEVGERHHPETHLIPLVLQVASGKRSSVDIFGRDYDTPDGTCIRDYVHVLDLAVAHELALKKLIANGGCYTCNLGTGQGYSVKQVIDTAKQITGRSITSVDKPRRVGDAARLVAEPKLSLSLLGWRPTMSNLDTIISHAWQWEKLSNLP